MSDLIDAIDPTWRPLAGRLAQALDCDVEEHGRLGVVPHVWITGSRTDAPRGVVGCRFGGETVHIWEDDAGEYRARRHRAEAVMRPSANGGWTRVDLVKPGATDLAAADLATLCRLDASVDGFLLAALGREGEDAVVRAMVRFGTEGRPT